MADAPVHLVIGAAGAVGSATVRRLADAGAHVVLAGRDVHSFPTRRSSDLRAHV